MRFSIVVLALSGSASALPALSGLAAHQPTELVDRGTGAEPASVADDLSRRGFKAEVVSADDTNAKKRDLEVVTRQTKTGSAAASKTSTGPHAEAIGDNKVNPTTGLTDSEAAEIVTGLDLKDKKAPGSLNAKGQRNPLPGLSADETDAIVKQGQAALKEAGA
ncbi:hypothetical protein K4K61_000224 [Colletotrichum sp. SAR11_59]|uniref:Uncharacterized protein n=1 Tax=Colletotrichum asianum TaxID=702518 RepID=A0A8H3ZIN7_9PEZI|nr:hypothetical protein GQ607_015429 [Colletotrichum asianum]KAI8310726.1 hypothetical protein K4K61_000224 [Colletotrichum sp. SAR11_59]